MTDSEPLTKPGVLLGEPFSAHGVLMAPRHSASLGLHSELKRYENFDLFISQFVLDEAAAGDSEAARRRMAALEGISLLDVTDDAIMLAEKLVAGGGMPSKARVDALHVAAAASHGMDYFLTWNCQHIANASLRGRIEDLCRAAGFEPPVICTPFELAQEWRQ
ncbi:MAG: type II toxin-antitoxin system VapC family toxin [Deltaproteobacteria bacterium]|nr:type II toxin-antitoxin system VapC family toxin [Deltaproteobacteria bacterium]